MQVELTRFRKNINFIHIYFCEARSTISAFISDSLGQPHARRGPRAESSPRPYFVRRRGPRDHVPKL